MSTIASVYAESGSAGSDYDNRTRMLVLMGLACVVIAALIQLKPQWRGWLRPLFLFAAIGSLLATALLLSSRQSGYNGPARNYYKDTLNQADEEVPLR
jgi:hypothetical protein